MTPYYADDLVTIYHGDVREVLPQIAPLAHDLTIADPPYGMSYEPGAVHQHALAFEPVLGDDQPFDPALLLGRGDLIAWGGNFYADRLPPMGGWIGWDKRTRDGLLVRSSEAEFAWTNCVASPKLFRFLWSGAFRDGERGFHAHPTQKPVELMSWCLSLVRGAARVIEPYAGLAPASRASKDAGIPAVAIELEERYCEIAARRCSQEVLGLVA
jgi:site-specific DNA-methyltransferase (adenine-specific)